MSDKLQEALINLLPILLPVLCGGVVGALGSIVGVLCNDWLEMRRRSVDLRRERRTHNISKIEDFLDLRISQIKSLTNPAININTTIEYLQSEISKQAGFSESARASAKFLGDLDLAGYLAEFENIFLRIWDFQKQAPTQQDLPELEQIATNIYHKCSERVEVLKRNS